MTIRGGYRLRRAAHAKIQNRRGLILAATKDNVKLWMVGVREITPGNLFPNGARGRKSFHLAMLSSRGFSACGLKTVAKPIPCGRSQKKPESGAALFTPSTLA
jgi:hypothetical protein